MRKRGRSIRPKKPYIATPDQVRITRDAQGAHIDYAEDGVSGVHLILRPEELASMTDEQILETHNDCVESQQWLADSYQWVAVEVPPGTPQVKRSRGTGQLVPRGDVLRCHIEHVGGEDHVSIYIDDKEYSLREFGEILSMYSGWGMRVAFVPEDEVHEEPVIAVRKPKKGR